MVRRLGRDRMTTIAMASVFLKRHTWYLRVRDASGRWVSKASTATTKTEARRLAVDLERRFERQQLGLEPADLEDRAERSLS